VTTNQIKELLQTEAFMRSVVKGTPIEADMNASINDVKPIITSLSKAIWAQPAGDSLVQFGADFEDPQVARQLATNLMQSYTLWKLNSDRQDSIAAQSFFSDLIQPYQDALDKARTELENYLADHPTPIRGNRSEIEAIEISRLQANVNSSDTRLQSAIDKEESARLAQIQAERNIQQRYMMLDTPRTPLTPTTSVKQLAMKALIFVVVGMILSLVGVIGGAIIDRTFRLPIDVVHSLELPLLALVPTNKISALARAAAQPVAGAVGETLTPSQPKIASSLAQSSHD
jgi:hypothetical protein